MAKKANAAVIMIARRAVPEKAGDSSGVGVVSSGVGVLGGEVVGVAVGAIVGVAVGPAVGVGAGVDVGVGVGVGAGVGVGVAKPEPGVGTGLSTKSLAWSVSKPAGWRSREWPAATSWQGGNIMESLSP